MCSVCVGRWAGARYFIKAPDSSLAWLCILYIAGRYAWLHLPTAPHPYLFKFALMIIAHGYLHNHLIPFAPCHWYILSFFCQFWFLLLNFNDEVFEVLLNARLLFCLQLEFLWNEKHIKAERITFIVICIKAYCFLFSKSMRYFSLFLWRTKRAQIVSCARVKSLLCWFSLRQSTQWKTFMALRGNEQC